MLNRWENEGERAQGRILLSWVPAIPRVYHMPGPLGGKQPQAFPLYPDFEPCDLLPRARDKPGTSSDHAVPTSDTPVCEVTIYRGRVRLPHVLYYKFPKWRNLNLCSKPERLTLLTEIIYISIVPGFSLSISLRTQVFLNPIQWFEFQMEEF